VQTPTRASATRTKPFRAVQFYPEALPGLLETGFLFDEFVEKL